MGKRTKCIAGSAAIGGLIGAGSGALVGSQASKPLGDELTREGALVGAAAGGLIGSIVGMIVCEADVDTDEDGVVDEKGAQTFKDTTLTYSGLHPASEPREFGTVVDCNPWVRQETRDNWCVAAWPDAQQPRLPD